LSKVFIAKSGIAWKRLRAPWLLFLVEGAMAFVSGKDAKRYEEA
jgi:hypothetical protein